MTRNGKFTFIQHSGKPFKYAGYTVCNGDFFGVATLPWCGLVPCFWSGWTFENACFVYIGRADENNGGSWVDDDWNVTFNVIAQPEYWEELRGLYATYHDDEIPFFMSQC